MVETNGAAVEAASPENVPVPGEPPAATDGKRVIRSASRRRSRSKKLGAPRYETLILVSAAMTAEEIEAARKVIIALIESLGGSDVSITDLGRKRLAYRIEEHTDGIYLNFLYAAPPALVAELDRELKLNDTVVRFLTTVADWSRS